MWPVLSVKNGTAQTPVSILSSRGSFYQPCYYPLTGSVLGQALLNVAASFLSNPLDCFVRIHILAREVEEDPLPQNPAFSGTNYCLVLSVPGLEL